MDTPQSISVILDPIEPAQVARVVKVVHGVSLATEAVLLTNAGEYHLSLHSVAEQIRDALGVTQDEWEDAGLQVSAVVAEADAITFFVTTGGWE